MSPRFAFRKNIDRGYPMGYSIKKHEVDRLANVLVPLGWEIKQEIYENSGVTLQIHKEISKELLLASGELEKLSSPQ